MIRVAARQSAAAPFYAPECQNSLHPTSYTLLAPLIGTLKARPSQSIRAAEASDGVSPVRPHGACAHSELSSYVQIIDDLEEVDAITRDAKGVLDAIANEAEHDCLGPVIAALARTLQARLANLEEASRNVRDYCRSTDLSAGRT